jgi:hypothetical protein
VLCKVHFNIITHTVPGFQSDIFLRVSFFLFFKILFFRVHPAHPSRSAQRNHEVTRSAVRPYTALSEPDTYQPIRSQIKHEVNCLSIFTSLSRRIRYMDVLFAELHLYQSHFLHHSHISSHRILWNWGSHVYMDTASAGLSYRSLNSIAAQLQTCHLRVDTTTELQNITTSDNTSTIVR